MRIKLQKLALSFAVVLVMSIVQSCQEKNDVTPHIAKSMNASASVLEEIKKLGFDAATIQDKGNYYLAEGDIYFAKNKTATRTRPVKGKTKMKIERGQRPSITVGIDKAVAANTTWKNGVDHAITTWNADKNHHFTFNMVERSELADIFIQGDNGELSEDVEVASEFAAHGYVGSTIRVNLDYTASTADQIKTKSFEALSHSVGLRHADFSQKNKLFKTQPAARAEVLPASEYVYLIQGDELYAVRPDPYHDYLVSTSWAGATRIASTRATLYVIQFDVLYAALPDGSWWGLTSGWSGTQSLISVPFDSYSLYAMQGDWLFGVNASDGWWWGVTDNGGTSTPWSDTKFMCAGADYANYPNREDGLIIHDRSNTAIPEESFVATDPANPNYGTRRVKRNYPQLKTIQALAPKVYKGVVGNSWIGEPSMYKIDSNPNTVYYFGLSDNAGSPGSIDLGNVKSDQVIDYSKVQSFVTDRRNICYLITDGGFYTYTGARRPNSQFSWLNTVFTPHSLLPTTIMTNFVPLPPTKVEITIDEKPNLSLP
jgi:hypothetical protein